MSGYRVECRVCGAFLSSGQEPEQGYVTNEESWDLPQDEQDRLFADRQATYDDWYDDWVKEADEFVAWHRENCGS